MNPRVLKGLGTALLLSTISATGCANQCQKELERLKGEYNALAAQKLELQGRLSRADVERNLLRDQLKAAQAGLETERTKAQALQGQAQRTEAALREAQQPSQAEKRLYEQTLESDILFASGSATLTAAGQQAISEVAAKIKADYPGRIVRIYGHTDTDPIVKSKKLWADNLDLSANRAMAVARHMIDRGIAAERIEPVAMGATRPVAGNDTKAGKARNRRVEIVVIQK